MIHVQECEKFSMAFEHYPWGGLPLFLTVISGRMMVCVLCPGTFTHMGADVHTYMSTAADTALRKCPMFCLTSGQSVWLPFGSKPLIMGISSDVEAFKKKGQEYEPDHVSFMINLALSADDVKVHAAIRSEVQVSVAASSPSMPECVHGNEHFLKWKSDVVSTFVASGSHSGAPGSAGAGASAPVVTA